MLGQIFEDRRPRDILTSGLPCWFGHLLPHPNGALYRILKDEARDRGFVDEDGDPGDFQILAMIGDDLPGAVELRPGARRWPASPRRQRAPAAEQAGLYPSLAGLQLKLTVNPLHEGGYTVPVSGRGGSWIAKFDQRELSSPRIEYSTTRWAAAAGITTPDVRLAAVREIRGLDMRFPREGEAFLTRRFDRAETGRVHVEDFAQIMDRPMPNGFFRGTAEELALLVYTLCRGASADLIKRLAFTALSREVDGHLKNHAVCYPDRRHAQLAPAFDLVAGVIGDATASDAHMVLPIGGSRRFEDLSEESFEGIDLLCGLAGDARAIAADAARAIRQAWRETVDVLPWTDREREILTRHMERVPLGRG